MDETIATPAGRVDRYGLALVLICGTIAIDFFDLASRILPVVGILLAGGAIVVVLTASDARRPVVIASRVFVSLAAVIAVTAALIGDDVVFLAMIGLLGALLAIVAPIPIALRLARQPAISMHTVLGAVCVYLLAGLFFAYVYLILDKVDGPVYNQIPVATLQDTIYGSFVTIATIGYGDLTPATELARLAVIVEGVGGQLYLVTIIALFVGNLGRTRHRLRSEVEGEVDTR
jgi:hypothetical protein